MTGLGVADSIQDELRNDLAAAFGDGGWFTHHVGGPAPSGTWTTRSALLADAPGGLSGLVALQRPHWPDLDPDLLWVELVSSLAAPVVYTASKLVEARSRYLVIDADALAVHVEFGEHRAWFSGTWYPNPVLQVLPDDPLAGASRVEVVASSEIMVRNLVDDSRRFLEPIIEAVRPNVSVGRRGLWGLTLDSLLWPYAVQDESEPPTAPRERVARVMDAAAGSPFSRRLDWIDFDHAGRACTELRTSSCCLHYKWPHTDETLRADGGDPRWNAYCMLCPLIPTDESVHRAIWWIEHPDGA